VSLADRLRARGVVDVGGFLAWAQSQAPVPLDGSTDRTLDSVVAEYRQAIGQPAGRRMDPATAHRLFEEGAARHRARLLAERVVREVIAERLRTPTLSETCPKCSATQRCWEHER
jgi:hypothetical protein